MVYVLIAVLFIFCIYDFLKNKQIFSPTFIFNLIWLITLLLYQLKLSYLQQDLSNRTISIFFGCVLLYNISVYFFKFFKLKKIKFKFKPKYGIKEKLKIAKYIAIGIFILEIIYSKGVPLVWKIIGSSKTYFDFGIPSLNGAFYGLIICLGAYSLFNKTKDKYIYLAMGILIISRQVILSMVIEGIVYALLNNKIKLSFKKVFIIAIITLVGFTALGNFRSGNNVMDKVFYAKEEYQKLPTSCKWVYSYMTFSISNFNNLVEMTNGGINYGASMLSDFLPTVILNKINVKLNWNHNYLVSQNYNVSTYLPSIYLDFGMIGVILFNILIGGLGYSLYNKMKNNKNDKNILMYSVFAHNIIFLFFINMFLYLPIIIQFIYIPLIFSKREEGE